MLLQAGADGELSVIPGTPLYSASVEKNSRGFTWKVSVGSEGVAWNTAFNGIKAAVADMTAEFGGPSGKGE